MCCKAESCGISLSAVILKSVCCRKSTFYSQTIALLPVFEEFAKQRSKYGYVLASLFHNIQCGFQCVILLFYGF